MCDILIERRNTMFAEWWNMLDAASQVFYCIAIPATLVLVIQTVMLFIGLGEAADGVDGIDGADDIGELGADSSADAHDLSDFDGLRVFTIRGIVAFFVVFGWVGIAMRSSGVGLGITIPVALVCGFAVMVGIAYLLRAVMKLRGSGNIDNQNAIGKACKVHLTVPGERSGQGKVHLMLQGSYVERDAVTDQPEAIPTGSEAVVVGVSGQTTLVIEKK